MVIAVSVELRPGLGGFQLDFVSISRVINHRTCYKLKLQHSEGRANLVKYFFLKINFPPLRALEFITGPVIYNPAYPYKFQLKTTHLANEINPGP